MGNCLCRALFHFHRLRPIAANSSVLLARVVPTFMDTSNIRSKVHFTSVGAVHESKAELVVSK